MVKVLFVKQQGEYYKISEEGIKHLPLEQVPKWVLVRDAQKELKAIKNANRAKWQKRKKLRLQQRLKRKRISAKHRHRKKMELYLRRKLKSDEHIHHLDNNPLNNNPRNLLITDAKEHRKIHKQLNKLMKQDLVGKKIVFDLKRRVYKSIPVNQKIKEINP